MPNNSLSVITDTLSPSSSSSEKPSGAKPFNIKTGATWASSISELKADGISALSNSSRNLAVCREIAITLADPLANASFIRSTGWSVEIESPSSSRSSCGEKLLGMKIGVAGNGYLSPRSSASMPNGLSSTLRCIDSIP